jgi:hypothetical protein
MIAALAAEVTVCGWLVTVPLREALHQAVNSCVRRFQMTTKVKAIQTATTTDSPSSQIDAKIEQLGDWRGKTLSHLRALIHQADPEVVEEWKWAKQKSPGTPVFSDRGIICTGETYKSVVKLTFAKGASLPDPSRLFNSSLEGNTRRAIDFHEDDKINDAAFKTLIRAAVALNKSLVR